MKTTGGSSLFTLVDLVLQVAVLEQDSEAEAEARYIGAIPRGQCFEFAPTAMIMQQLALLLSSCCYRIFGNASAIEWFDHK